MESWTYWWSFNKERFLKLRERIGQVDGPVTGDELLRGESSRKDMHPTREQLANEVTPALLETLAKDSDATVLAATMIAAAKIGEKPDLVFEQLKRLLQHSNTQVVENAALSLGVLGEPAALDLLKSLVEDSDAGRKAVGNAKEVPWRVRTLAAYGLGLAGARTRNPYHHRNAQNALLAILTDPANRMVRDDIAVAVIIALGMMPDREGMAIAQMEKYFGEYYEKEELICSHIPPSIARILNDRSANERERYGAVALQYFKNPGKGAQKLIRSGTAIALGIITKANDTGAPAIVAELRTAAEERLNKYPEAAYMSLISLGEIAGTGQPGSDIEKYLISKATAQGGRVMTRAWAALALGIEGFHQTERTAGAGVAQPDPARDAIAQILVDAMLLIKDPEQRSAFAVGLGLRRARQATPGLLKCIEEVRVDDFRGYFALALGMTGARETAPAVLEFVKKEARHPGFFQQAAIGLALMGDKSVVPVLIELLKDDGTQSFILQSAIADSLGYVGDYRAVAPLVELLKDEKKQRTKLTRAFASVALGLVGDKELQPWNSKISAHLNYFGFVETLTDLIWEQ